MTPDEVLALAQLLARLQLTVGELEQQLTATRRDVTRKTAECDELTARLAAMEAERDMLREDDVTTSGEHEGMVPDDTSTNR